ncbi:MAG TPA: class II aldolase/adducin family protein [Anaerolineaceae bacterium]
MEPQAILKELIQLSRELGQESRQLAILGEGNTSADCGDGTFWVKASGSQLGTLDESGVSRVSFAAVEELASRPNLTEEDVETGLRNALVDKTQKKPSVETFLHAICLQQPDVHFVGHTHPVAVNQILCSKMGAEPFMQHLFPDGVVVCGIAPMVIPFVDPGVKLSRAANDAFKRYQDQWGRSPKVILMVNHGLVGLGKTAKEALNISLMADKFARILAGTLAFGGPNYFSLETTLRVDNRLDEVYRRKVLENKGG